MVKSLAVTAVLLLVMAAILCEAYAYGYGSMDTLQRSTRGSCDCCKLSLHDRCCTQCLVRLGKRNGAGSDAQDADVASLRRAMACRCCEESDYTNGACCLVCKLSLSDTASV